jgi:hypothetical protein
LAEIANAKPSSWVGSIHYDPATKELQVHTLKGEKYAYDGVSAADHNAFVSADSHGRHFSTVFSKKYKGRKL